MGSLPTSKRMWERGLHDFRDSLRNCTRTMDVDKMMAGYRDSLEQWRLMVQQGYYHSFAQFPVPCPPDASHPNLKKKKNWESAVNEFHHNVSKCVCMMDRDRMMAESWEAELTDSDDVVTQCPSPSSAPSSSPSP